MSRLALSLGLFLSVSINVVAASAGVRTQTAPVPSAEEKTPFLEKNATDTELKAVFVNGHDSRNSASSTISKTVVTQEDLSRFGDSNVADVLKRLPGITISGIPGRGGEIRMRGLGAGYTQLLINGDPVASGFSIDSISPNLIERIEVTRTATADISAQAIAGTINIILKQVVRKQQRDLKLAVSSDRGRPSEYFDAQLSDRKGAVSYTLTAGS